MAEHASKQTVAHPRGDLEMSDIRLLDEEDDDDLIFGQSNLTSVLANPDFGRRRWSVTYCLCYSHGSLNLKVAVHVGLGTGFSTF